MLTNFMANVKKEAYKSISHGDFFSSLFCVCRFEDEEKKSTEMMDISWTLYKQFDV